jgi:hypothetical protein
MWIGCQSKKWWLQWMSHNLLGDISKTFLFAWPSSIKTCMWFLNACIQHCYSDGDQIHNIWCYLNDGRAVARPRHKHTWCVIGMFTAHWLCIAFVTTFSWVFCYKLMIKSLATQHKYTTTTYYGNTCTNQTVNCDKNVGHGIQWHTWHM